MSFTRRQFLAGLAGLGVVGLAGSGVRYWLGRPVDVTTHDYELIAAPLDVELVPGHVTPAWAYGGQAPGLELRCRQGERLRVRFVNKLEVETTIHWHGIRLPLDMDGVPYVSHLPVKPGEYFDYDFICPDAGSYWYHPHTASHEQLGRGLVGPLIVEEREPSGFRHERTLNLKSWHIDKQGAFTEFSVPREAARGGTPGVLSTVNGRHAPLLDLPAGQVVRLRVLNLDNTLTYRLNLPDGEARLYALDGHPIARLATHRIARLGLGYVPEDRRIFTDLTVAENLDVGRRPPADGGPAPWTPERLFSIFPNLAEMRGRRASAMSGGEQQMLTIARTLMGNPRAVLLDEPSEGLAPVIVEQMADAVLRMKGEGIAVLLSEQNLHFASAVADRAYVIEKGAVRYEGTTAELEARPGVREAYLTV